MKWETNISEHFFIAKITQNAHFLKKIHKIWEFLVLTNFTQMLSLRVGRVQRLMLSQFLCQLWHPGMSNTEFCWKMANFCSRFLSFSWKCLTRLRVELFEHFKMLNICNLGWGTRWRGWRRHLSTPTWSKWPKTAKKVPFFALCQIWGQFAAKELIGFF